MSRRSYVTTVLGMWGSGLLGLISLKKTVIHFFSILYTLYAILYTICSILYTLYSILKPYPLEDTELLLAGATARSGKNLAVALVH